MALTQDFKNQCEALLTKWQQFIGEKWQGTTWPILVKRTKEGKDKILTDPFFISFKNKSEEEQKWMLKRIEFWYNTKGQGYIEPYAALYYCIGSVQGATGDGVAELAVNIFQLKNDFLKMIDWEKWTTEKHTDADLEKHKPEDLKPADYDDLKNAIKGVYPNYPTIMEEEKPENIKKYIKGLEDANTKLTTDKGTAEINLKEAIKAKEKAEGEASQGKGTSDKALNKLLTFYKEEITKRTQLFYQDLNLDNNWINEKYGNSEINYFDLLKNLTIDSEPEQVINAFRIVALIKATEKAQETHNKYKDRLATLSPNLKINNRSKFNKIKDIWDLITDEPTEANNPLYLAIIKDQGKYKQQLNDIINLWQ